ncbi:MAG TPA: VWA domain-containing protein [Terriglobales bacterium]|nr:VWA domain-containing protein [Terriglobales bacterium]
MCSESNTLERGRICVLLLFATVTLIVLGIPSFAQSQDTLSYNSAVAERTTSARVAGLEDFLTSAPASTLRPSALAWLAWEYHRSGNAAQSSSAARELLALEPENALALALLTALRSDEASSSKVDDQAFSMAKRGIANFERLQKPQGMDDASFAALKREIYGMLNATVGFAYFEGKDYVTARGYLRNAVAVRPDDSRYVYALGVSDLNGRDLNPNEGFWMLARAVALNQGSASANQISEYASQKYQEAGGSLGNWQKFIAAAQASISSPRATTTSGTALAATSASSTSAASKTREIATSRSVPSAASPVSRASTAPSPSVGGERAEVSASRPSVATPPRVPERTIAPFPPGMPVSLGIVIEASHARKENKEAILQGLSGIVRRLRPKDEAFVLAFGDQLDLEQDLTQNYKLLEEAMETIEPHSGAALYDAIGFAAGHLKRIAKNEKHALLVISDGRNNSKESSLRLASEIESLRIFCIGLDVDAPEARYILEALAGRTGGQATFISAPEQFEAAAQELAGLIYGPERGLASR